jgi:hypothetical protein
MSTRGQQFFILNCWGLRQPGEWSPALVPELVAISAHWVPNVTVGGIQPCPEPI